jgi:demethylmenaquinone methyltransferase / 2-methoxy-6-polyprenyl-1,4-benzoquinol methylase
MQIQARELFDGIAPRYDATAEALSFGQYARWRRALVRGLDLSPGAHVLDVATGTGLIARLLRSRGFNVTGVDLTEAMLRRASGQRVAGDANALPFPDVTFDALTFSYLFRYVDDPPATLSELVRVIRPGGIIASVEFGVPSAAWARAGWSAYARGAFPLLARLVSPGWREVGDFLPSSIVAWARDWPVQRQVEMWRDAGLVDVRAQEMTLGTAVVMWGRVP